MTDEMSTEGSSVPASDRRRRLNFGALSAEDEKTALPRQFVERPEYDDVRNGTAAIIVGPKGGGKSAIRVKLLDEANDNLHFIDISPNEIGWAEIKTYADCGIGAGQAKKAAWMTLFLIDVVEYLDRVRGPVYPIDLVNDILVDAKVLPSKRLSLKEVGVHLKTVSATFGRGETVTGLEFPTLVRAVRDCFKILDEALQADGRAIRLLVDRLDENWLGGEQDNLTLEGLFHAVRDLNYETQAIRVQVFLRTDIWTRLKFYDKDKFKASIFHLHWSERELLSLVAQRIRRSTGLTSSDDVFIVDWAFVSHLDRVEGRAGRPPTLKHVLSVINHRPRDLIYVCDYAARNRRDRSTQIGSENVLAALREYSRNRLDNIQNSETVRTAPEMTRILRALHGSQMTISWKGLREKISGLGTEFAEMEREYLYYLLEYEVLGFDGNPVLFYSDDSSILEIEPRADTAFAFHPSLRFALDLRGNMASTFGGQT